MKKWWLRIVWGIAGLLFLAAGVWYAVFGYTCRRFEPQFHSCWSEEARAEWRHLDHLLRHDLASASLLMLETGMLDSDGAMLTIPHRVEQMLELVEYAAEHGALKAERNGEECSVHRAQLSEVLVKGGYLHILENMDDKASFLFDPARVDDGRFTLMARLVVGDSLATLREERVSTPLPQRWAMVKSLLESRDELTHDVVNAIAFLSLEQKDASYALYVAEYFELYRSQKMQLAHLGMMMDNGLPLLRYMLLESGCPTEYFSREHQRSFSLKCGLAGFGGNDADEKIRFLMEGGYITAEEADAARDAAAKKARRDAAAAQRAE